MKVIGLMEDTMGLGLRVGLEEVSTRDNINKDQDMDMVFTGFTLEILILENGVTDRVMVLVFRHVLMVAVTLESSNLVSNMALAVTILGIFLSLIWVFGCFNLKVGIFF